MIVTVPYLFKSTKEDGVRTSVDGFSDMTVEFKWRFFETEGFSFAVKPGISVPTGDDTVGLGSGRVGGSIFLIATKEMDPWVFHFNAGYIRNENRFDDEKDLWHFSFAAQYQVCKWLKVVGNVGVERNPDRSDNTPSAFILGGVIFPVTEKMDLSFGVKGGLTPPENDISTLAGVTYRF